MYLVKLNDGTSFKTLEDIDKIFMVHREFFTENIFFVFSDLDGYKHYIPKHSLVEIVEGF